MGNEVFANGNEIACKSGDGKVIAAFPDVCLSPPSPPAGPIPVPYPDTSFSKDMKNGSKTVKIDGKEVMLKDKSFYKTSPLGNEAATKSLGAGVVSHVITGKTYFVAWSMDVKFEGLNVPRHIDLTTSNHASPMANSLPNTNISEQSKKRIMWDKCPCCDQKIGVCAAALSVFKESLETLTLEQYYRLDEPGFQDRKEQYNQMTQKKTNNCSCDGKVFPEPPCNVFRRVSSDRAKTIEDQWSRMGNKENYARQYRKQNPDAIRKFMKKNHDEKKPKEHGTFDEVCHLVPISAGGCPDDPTNLQPKDLLCSVCKKIDKQFTTWQSAEARSRQ